MAMEGLLDLQRYFKANTNYKFVVKLGHSFNIDLGSYDIATITFNSISIGVHPDVIGFKDSFGYLGLWGVSDLHIKESREGNIIIDFVPDGLGEDAYCTIECITVHTE